ncbi:MAG: NAD(P)/FAD-dependent oxidoreductase [Mariniphaga sp.]
MLQQLDINIPRPEKGQQRIIILGAGFGGLRLARQLARAGRFQILLIDRNNYHQFQPLLYQVATAGLEPSSISFPIRKIFQKKKNVFIRIAEIEAVVPETNTVKTNIGQFSYHKLVIALGTTTNFFGNNKIEENSIGLKTVSEALYIRNQILKNYENALVSENDEVREAALNIAIVGGGPTGVELAGAIAELRNNILPKEYPELDFSKMNIFLIEATNRLLGGMSDFSSQKAKKYLQKLGVKVLTGTMVKFCEGNKVITDTGIILSSNVVWAAGMKGATLNGIPPAAVSQNGRIEVDSFNRVKGLENLFAISDLALMRTPEYPNGHPQVAPVAIQQAENLARYFLTERENKKPKPFSYKDKGTMATVGRNLAVVELPFAKYGGFFAWATWMFVHLMSILGVKNRFFIFINWLTNYFTYNLSLRLIIKPKKQNISS